MRMPQLCIRPAVNEDHRHVLLPACTGENLTW